MLSGPRRKFCEGIVSGLNATQAYRAAYPKSAPATARCAASALLTKPEIKATIAELRALADQMAGSAVLTVMEKRIFAARVVRARLSELPEDSDLFVSIKRHKRKGKQGEEDGEIIEYRLPDKLKAIEIDNDLAGDGNEAEANSAFAAMLKRLRK